jgi:hypothetical protein
MVQEWPAQLLECGVQKLALALDSDNPYHSHTGCRALGLLEQGRFADAGLAVHNQRGALPAPELGNQAL